MAKWKARARAAVERGDTQFLRRQLEETRREAAGAGRDLRLLLEESGRKLDSEPAPSIDSLNEVERHYRALARETRTTSDELVAIERLMALLLGETLIRIHGGAWDIYTGPFTTASPVVLRLDPSGKHFDVAMLARQLHEKRNLDGAAEGRALATSIEKAEALSF